MGQSALPVSQLPWRFTLLTLFSFPHIFLLYTQLMLLDFLTLSITGSAMFHHPGRRWGREGVGDVPCAMPGWLSWAGVR